MFEAHTYDAILKEAKSFIPGNIQKEEGSLVFNALSVIAYEMEKLYIEADFIMNQTFASTADFEHLALRAKERGIEPYEATNAYVKACFSVPPPIGARFNLKAYNYVVIEELEQGFYKLKCEEKGTGPNELTGNLTAITYVEGLTDSFITEILIPGKSAETKEEFYKRYLDSFKINSFGGNISSYKKHIESMEGIGGAKIFPVWQGGGTVKAVIMDSNFKGASDYLIEQIQTELCPEPYMGYGYAPIGHDVTVMSAEERQIIIATDITFEQGYNWELLNGEINKTVENYLFDLRKTWSGGGENDFITIYISRLESAVLNGVKAVVDINNTSINGKKENLSLKPEQLPVLGGIIQNGD